MFLLVFPCFFRRRKQIASPFILCLPCSKKNKGKRIYLIYLKNLLNIIY